MVSWVKGLSFVAITAVPFASVEDSQDTTEGAGRIDYVARMIGIYAYSYVVLLLGAISAFYGAPVWTVGVMATLLMLPTLAGQRDCRFRPGEVALGTANSLLFGLIAFGVGRGVAFFPGA